MPAPTVVIPTSGTNPAVTSKAAVEAALNAAFAQLLPLLPDGALAVLDQVQAAADQATALGTVYTQTDADMASVTVPAQATLLHRIPASASAGQVAPVGTLSHWRRVTSSGSAPYFTSAGGVVWERTGLYEDLVLSLVQSTLAGAFPNTPQTSVTDATAGRLLLVGGFGLGSTSVPEITDLTVELPSGEYQVPSANAATSGGPDTQAYSGAVSVMRLRSGWTHFFYRRFSETRIRAWIGARAAVTGAIVWAELLVGTPQPVLSNYADDAAAAAGGIAVGQFYRTGSTIKVRVA